MTEMCYKEHVENFDLERVNDEIEALCDENGLGSQKLFLVQLVVEELVTNVKKYGGRGEANETVEIRLAIKDDKAHLTIRDNVKEFNPLLREDPDVSLSAGERTAGGLGLFIVRRKVSELHYSYADNYNIIEAVI